ncbi:MAG: hypothetical protein U5K27_07085 [Desulfotignum sp.]|nr:hypothetical protein [Desulfotignum sp.]
MFGKLEAEEQPSRYAEFVSQVLRQALLEEPDPERRRALCDPDHRSAVAGFPRPTVGSANMPHAAMTSGLEWNLKVTSLGPEAVLCPWRCLRRTDGAGDGNPALPFEII